MTTLHPMWRQSNLCEPIDAPRFCDVALIGSDTDRSPQLFDVPRGRPAVNELACGPLSSYVRLHGLGLGGLPHGGYPLAAEIVWTTDDRARLPHGLDHVAKGRELMAGLALRSRRLWVRSVPEAAYPHAQHRFVLRCNDALVHDRTVSRIVVLSRPGERSSQPGAVPATEHAQVAGANPGILNEPRPAIDTDHSQRARSPRLIVTTGSSDGSSRPPCCDAVGSSWQRTTRRRCRLC